MRHDRIIELILPYIQYTKTCLSCNMNTSEQKTYRCSDEIKKGKKREFIKQME